MKARALALKAHQPCLEGHHLQAPRAAVGTRQSAQPSAGDVGTWAGAVMDQSRGEAGRWVPSASKGIVGGSDWSTTECCLLHPMLPSAGLGFAGVSPAQKCLGRSKGQG